MNITKLDYESSSRYIRAFIDESGNAGLHVQDLYDEFNPQIGSDEYEFFTFVEASRKDDLILVLLKKLYENNPNAAAEFMELMNEPDIPCNRFVR